jgi:hypothetical protein
MHALTMCASSSSLRLSAQLPPPPPPPPLACGWCGASDAALPQSPVGSTIAPVTLSEHTCPRGRVGALVAATITAKPVRVRSLKAVTPGPCTTAVATLQSSVQCVLLKLVASSCNLEQSTLNFELAQLLRRSPEDADTCQPTTGCTTLVLRCSQLGLGEGGWDNS